MASWQTCAEVGDDCPLMPLFLVIQTFSSVDRRRSVELRNALARSFALELPPTLTFDYPTTAAVSAYIAEQLGATTEQVGT